MLSFLALVAVILASTAEPSFFPKPSSYVPGPASTCGNFVSNHKVTALSDDDVANAKRYLSNLSNFIFYTDKAPSGNVNSIETVISSTATIPMEAEQGYSISFSGSKILINADTIFGAYYAYETLSQMIKYDEDKNSYMIYTYTIQDKPRFPWRGLHIDTARHFLPMSAIKRQIIGMASAKMNVLHWHIADAESFSWKPTNTPDMSKAAYKGGKLYYTSEQVKNIVDFAKEWGVHVYIEIDTPGHTYSWKKAYPSIVADCPSKSKNINNVALDISQDLTYTIASQLYNELIELTGKYIHLGGDEVVTSCWKEDPDTSAWMKEEGYSVYDIWSRFETRLDGMINSEAVPIFWQEAFQYNVINAVRTTAIIQSWEDQATLGSIVKAGYRGLLSGGWYLDKQIPALNGTTRYAFYETWKDFYNNEPTAGLNLTEEEEKRILGGEACMWSEGIDVGAIDTYIWPRTLAVSERLWSSKYTTDLDDAKARIQVQRCTLLRRGIGAGPVGPNEPCDGQFDHWNYVQYNEN